MYFKSLHLSSESRKDHTVGELANMMTVDVQKVQDVVVDIDELWAAPIMIILTTVFFWKMFGIASLSVYSLVIVYGIINCVILVPQQNKYQDKQMIHKDSRMKVISEILNGIKVGYRTKTVTIEFDFFFLCKS